jgi:serine/threonine-protein kinase
VAGGDLDDLMRRKPGPKLAVNEGVYLMRRVAGAMAYAHEQGIVHRDLKPSNVLLRADTGEPVVTDLGIAAFAGANPLTGTMESLGTPQYMAPEQVSSHAPADGRADIYAIGVMLHELLTARLPFEGDNNWSILFRKQQEDAPSVLAARPNLDPRLAAVVDTCLRRDPADRYQTAGALAAALDALLPADAHPPMPVVVKSKKGVAATPSNPPVAAGVVPLPVAEPAGGRRSMLPWAGGAALLLLLLLAGFWLFGGGGGGGEPTAAPAIAAATGKPAADDSATTNEDESGAPTSTAAAVAGQATDSPAADDEAGRATSTRRATRRAATPTRRPATATPGSRAAVAATTAPATTAPVLLEPPPATCPPGATSPQYTGNATITFRWRWPQLPAAGHGLEVQAGPVGSLRSLGRVDPAVHRQANGEWAFPAAVATIAQGGGTEFSWRVVYRATAGAEVAVSPVACFRISGGGDSGGAQPTDTPRPADTARPTDPPRATDTPQPTATTQPTSPPLPTVTIAPTIYVEPPTETPNPTEPYYPPPQATDTPNPPYP